jgi:hypothetical protein
VRSHSSRPIKELTNDLDHRPRDTARWLVESSFRTREFRNCELKEWSMPLEILKREFPIQSRPLDREKILVVEPEDTWRWFNTSLTGKSKTVSANLPNK